MTVKQPLTTSEPDNLAVAPELEQDFLRLDKMLGRVKWNYRIFLTSVALGGLGLLALTWYLWDSIIAIPKPESVMIWLGGIVLFLVLVFSIGAYQLVCEEFARKLFVKITNEIDAKAYKNNLYRVGKYKYVISKFYALVGDTLSDSQRDLRIYLTGSIVLLLILPLLTFIGTSAYHKRKAQKFQHQIDSLKHIIHLQELQKPKK